MSGLPVAGVKLPFAKSVNIASGALTVRVAGDTTIPSPVALSTASLRVQ